MFPRFLAVHVLITATSQSVAPSTLLLLSHTRPVPYSERQLTAAKTNQEWTTDCCAAKILFERIFTNFFGHMYRNFN